MKSTGIVRRLDELGRIVIPKEIRSNLKIRDGENMEIFVDLDTIILKKYSKIEDSIDFTKKTCKVLNTVIGKDIIITDRDHIIAAEGNAVESGLNQLISAELTAVIDNRETFISQKETTVEITKELKLVGFFTIVPIITSADSVGLVIIYDKENNINENKGITRFIANLISAQIDVTWG